MDTCYKTENMVEKLKGEGLIWINYNNFHGTEAYLKIRQKQFNIVDDYIEKMVKKSKTRTLLYVSSLYGTPLALFPTPKS